ncbi:MAG: carbohydrate binding domain-containing protein [Prosthecobacter sp.]|nr:carbohydrate binding domain-containing protein [Prosthecobacter sp.]
MKTTCISLIGLVAVSAFAADPLDLKNGDFEKGKQFWRGDGKIVSETEANKVCELKASERYGDEITQEIDLGKNTKVEIALRMKGIDYKGAGLRISMKQRGGGSTFNTREVTEGAWTDMKFTFTRNSPEEKYTLIIAPMMGKGSIQIDDVKIGTGGTSPKTQ